MALQARRTKERRRSGREARRRPLSADRAVASRAASPTVVTLHDVQHRDLPEFFGPARRSFRRLAYDRAARVGGRRDRDERVRARARPRRPRPRPGAHPRRAARDRPHGLPARRRRSASRIAPLPGARRGRTRTTRACSRPSRCSARRGRSSDSILTGGGLERLEPLPGRSREPRLRPGGAARVALPPRGAASSTRASTRASGSRRSRRWRAAARVAASNAGAIPEVCGDAAVLFDPTDVGGDGVRRWSKPTTAARNSASWVSHAPRSSRGTRRPEGTKRVRGSSSAAPAGTPTTP